MIPPPANGSKNSLGLEESDRSHVRAFGTSQVLPPGYRNGLRFGMEATLTIRESDNSMAPRLFDLALVRPVASPRQIFYQVCAATR